MTKSLSAQLDYLSNQIKYDFGIRENGPFANLVNSPKTRLINHNVTILAYNISTLGAIISVSCAILCALVSHQLMFVGYTFTAVVLLYKREQLKEILAGFWVEKSANQAQKMGANLVNIATQTIFGSILFTEQDQELFGGEDCGFQGWFKTVTSLVVVCRTLNADKIINDLTRNPKPQGFTTTTLIFISLMGMSYTAQSEKHRKQVIRELTRS